eukprot:1703137-Amphidinium_carterae.1
MATNIKHGPSCYTFSFGLGTGGDPKQRHPYIETCHVVECRHMFVFCVFAMICEITHTTLATRVS